MTTPSYTLSAHLFYTRTRTLIHNRSTVRSERMDIREPAQCPPGDPLFRHQFFFVYKANQIYQPTTVTGHRTKWTHIYWAQIILVNPKPNKTLFIKMKFIVLVRFIQIVLNTSFPLIWHFKFKFYSCDILCNCLKSQIVVCARLIY